MGSLEPACDQIQHPHSHVRIAGEDGTKSFAADGQCTNRGDRLGSLKIAAVAGSGQSAKKLARNEQVEHHIFAAGGMPQQFDPSLGNYKKRFGWITGKIWIISGLKTFLMKLLVDFGDLVMPERAK